MALSPLPAPPACLLLISSPQLPPDTLVHQVSTHIAEARPAAELTAALTAVGQPQQLTRRLRSTEELVTAAAKAPRVGRARGAQGPNPVTRELPCPVVAGRWPGWRPGRVPAGLAPSPVGAAAAGSPLAPLCPMLKSPLSLPPVSSPAHFHTEPDIPAYVALRPDQRHERALVWFSVPILMGIIVGLFMIVMFSVGIAGIMRTQTMERWPDASHDKNLIVPQ